MHLDAHLQGIIETNKHIFTEEEQNFLHMHLSVKDDSLYYFNLESFLEFMMTISENRIGKCLFSFQPANYDAKIIYSIYKYQILDTKHGRKFLKKIPHMKNIFDEELSESLKNTYNNNTEKEESNYLNKYFEVGKKYYSKRKNFMVLFKNFCSFIVILNKRIKE